MTVNQAETASNEAKVITIKVQPETGLLGQVNVRTLVFRPPQFKLIWTWEWLIDVRQVFLQEIVLLWKMWNTCISDFIDEKAAGMNFYALPIWMFWIFARFWPVPLHAQAYSASSPDLLTTTKSPRNASNQKVFKSHRRKDDTSFLLHLVDDLLRFRRGIDLRKRSSR